MQNEKHQKAFTIVELLVVMAVIGILISLAVVGIQAIQNSQRQLGIANDLRNFDALLNEYYGKYRLYPNLDSDGFFTETSGPYTRVVLDKTLPNLGICLVIPGQEGVSSACNVDNLDKNKYFSGVKMSQPTISDVITFGGNIGDPVVRATYFSSGQVKNDCNYHINAGNVGVDKWALIYGTYPASQEYMLSACNEQGVLQNMGSFSGKLP